MNQKLLNELERKIKARQIVLEIQPDLSVKQCPWSERKDQLILKAKDYELNLTKLFGEMENSKTNHCNCLACPKDFFSFLFRNFKKH